jgi:outer membrane protein TolC
MLTRSLLYNIITKISAQILYIIFISCPAFSGKLEPSSDPKTITYKDALERALIHDIDLKIARNNLEHSRAQKIGSIAAFLPKVKVHGHYVKNIPKSKVSLVQPNDHLAQLSRKVASLLNSAGDKASAEQLESEADLLLRRPALDAVVSRPDHAIEGTLSLVIPLFNTYDIGRLVFNNNYIKLNEMHVGSQKAISLFSAAHSYIEAAYFKKLAALLKTQGEEAEKEHKKILKRFKHNIVSDVQILLSEHAHEDLKLGYLEAQQEYNNALVRLGLVINEDKDFNIEDPEHELLLISEDNEANLIALARSLRPDIKEQEQALNATHIERYGTILQFLPNFFAQADINFTSNSKGFINRPISYAFFINAHYELLSGGASLGLLKENALKKQRERLRLEELQQKIASQIRGRKDNIERALLAIKTQHSLLSYALKLEKSIYSRYTRGQAQLESLLETRKIKYEAEAALKTLEFKLKEERLYLLYEVGLLNPEYLSKLKD